MKTLLWITYVCTGILVTHNTLCMEPEYLFLEEKQSNNKRLKLELSEDEQDKINAKLITAVMDNKIQDALNSLNAGANLSVRINNNQNILGHLEQRIITRLCSNDDMLDWVYDLATPLALAAQMGFSDLIESLVKYIPDNQITKYTLLGQALLAAFLKDKTEAMRVLIKNGADVNYYHLVVDHDAPYLGQAGNIIHYMWCKTSKEALSLLLDNGANIHLKNQDKLTLIEIAAENNNLAAIDLVFEHMKIIPIKDLQKALSYALTAEAKTALHVLKYCMPSHNLYSLDAYKKLKILLLGFYKKDQSNPSALNTLPKELLYTIIDYTPELIFNKKLLTQIISRNQYNERHVSNCNDNAQDINYLLEPIAHTTINAKDNRLVQAFKLNIFSEQEESDTEPEQESMSQSKEEQEESDIEPDDKVYSTKYLTGYDPESKRLLKRLLDPDTPHNDPCYEKLLVMKLWDDLQNKNDTAASKNKSKDVESLDGRSNGGPIDPTSNSGKQEE